MFKAQCLPASSVDRWFLEETRMEADVTQEPEKEREPRDADVRGTKDDAGS